MNTSWKKQRKTLRITPKTSQNSKTIDLTGSEKAQASYGFKTSTPLLKKTNTNEPAAKNKNDPPRTANHKLNKKITKKDPAFVHTQGSDRSKRTRKRNQPLSDGRCPFHSNTIYPNSHFIQEAQMNSGGSMTNPFLLFQEGESMANPFLLSQEEESWTTAERSQVPVEMHEEPNEPGLFMPIVSQTARIPLLDSNEPSISINHTFGADNPFLPFFQLNVSASTFQMNPFDQNLLTSTMATSFFRLPGPLLGQLSINFGVFTNQPDFLSQPVMPFQIGDNPFEYSPFLFTSWPQKVEEVKINGITEAQVKANPSQYSLEISDTEQEQLKDQKLPICSICLSEYLPRNSVKFPCSAEHSFHAICLFHWAEEKKPVVCPLCRAPLKRPIEV